MGDYDQEGGMSDQTKAFHALVGRALVDASFRDTLRSSDRRQAMIDIGVEPTPEIEQALDEAIKTVDNLAQQFGDVQAAT